MKFSAKIRLLLCLMAALVILLLSAWNQSEDSIWTEQEYDVRVINGFRDNSSLPLVIWCSSSSKDDEHVDLGGRALQEGDDFGWILRTRFWDSSSVRVLCTMKWDGKRRKFEAFKVPRDLRRCNPTRKCSWLVREDGFYFSSDEVNWKKDFSWDS